MTPEDKARVLEIQARAEKTSPGPWVHTSGATHYVRTPSGQWVASVKGRDAEFIASARADVPWLCEQLLEALAELAATRGLSDAHGGIVPYTSIPSKTTHD